jgi:uncharacterized protein YdiU (UPF0061 family)
MKNPLSTMQGWNLEHSYSRLPPLFFEPWEPTPVREPRLVVLNEALAAELGLDPVALSRPDNADLFTGNRLPPGAFPIAQAYAGHQYGNFTGLGDGRALLLGEQMTPDGRRFDLQFKGSGPTAFSRRGDGRAALGPMLREYLISEAMNAFGIPTTRSLAVAATGEEVFRPEPLPGAVLTRVAASHIRVGTFEWAAAHRNTDALRALADYTLQRHYPQITDEENPYLVLLDAVIERQAALIARWTGVGFVHGVMNTDNMSISGETIDYGPCAFMDKYDPATVFSSIDRHGRYAFGNQPVIARWNLARFAECLLPLLHEDETHAVAMAEEAVNRFTDHYQHHWLRIMGAKIGLFHPTDDDIPLVESFLDWMHRKGRDYTITFRTLAIPGANDTTPFADPEFAIWHDKWTERLGGQSETRTEAAARMRGHNPAVIPRNHLVEEALSAATSDGDLSPFHRLLDVLSTPFVEPAEDRYSMEPPPTSEPYRTFCGT